MDNSKNSLPNSDSLNINALSRIFQNTTNSYKLLFFISLLDILERRNFDVIEPISFHDLTIEMLANAWFPHTFFKLSFGKQDQIAQMLDNLDLEINSPISKLSLIEAIAPQILDNNNTLMSYVPYRLLVPFLTDELTIKNVNLGTGNNLEQAMPSIANTYFKNKNPLYKFNSDLYNECTHIEFNRLWAVYLQEHISIIRAWASWHWLEYMQKRNLSTPSLSNKLFIPSTRAPLTEQRNYWRNILEDEEGQNMRCIYSGESLNQINFALDHYLPWSFIAHDQLWNLVPTLLTVNSSKSNNLPDEHYLEKFILMQFNGLMIAKRIFPQTKFESNTEHFIADLSLRYTTDLLDLKKLQEAYRSTISPLTLLASNQGFSTEWIYPKN